jgi:hypothetical protein
MQLIAISQNITGKYRISESRGQLLGLTSLEVLAGRAKKPFLSFG